MALFKACTEPYQLELLGLGWEWGAGAPPFLASGVALGVPPPAPRALKESESVVSQSCLTRDPMDYSPPSFSVHGILQARILEWVAISFSRDRPNPGMKPGSPALQADALLSGPPGKPRTLRGQ